MNILEEVKRIVKEECIKDTNMFTMAIYNTHLVPMVDYSKKLAKKLGADEEVVEIAVWLHDIGSITGNYGEYHTVGAKYAEELLKKLNYPKDKIDKIKYSLIAHRSSVKIPRETPEAQCVASADQMTHFNDITSAFNLALVIKKLGIKDSKKFVKNKLQKGWDKMIPEAKEMVKDKYEAAMILLE